MVQEANISLNNDAYLIIVGGESKDNYKTQIQPFDKSVANNSQNILNTPLKGKIANVALAGITSPIAQNLASKALPNALLGRINSSLYDIMADGKISNQEVAEDFIGSCTNQLDNIATDLGFPTPSALYSALMPNGSYISADLTQKLMKKFSNQSNIQNQQIFKESQIPKDIIIVKLKLINEDTEDLGIEIPTRKTENNFNIATAVNNQNLERTFTAKIVHNINKKVNMIDVKNQLKKLREIRSYVDVYICDGDIKEMETIKDCLLSTLNFSVDGVNSLDCNIGFVQVPKWQVKIDATLDKSLSNSNTGKDGANKGGKAGRKVNADPKTKKTQVKTPSSMALKGKDAVKNYNERAKNIKNLLKNNSPQKALEHANSLAKHMNTDYQAQSNTPLTGDIVLEMVKKDIPVYTYSEIRAMPKKEVYWDGFGNIHFK